ncbi:hydrogenase nickel incorporation protein HypB [Carboxydocella sporoproducens DSM 16521]|uniref:Hydrogenase nickel incorporation protein HypB n=3 Tax=Clostridiales Family XVI. Incertae Sedis TaxID=543347 RepID=A0A1T4RRQ3_9FIRM|nr:Hydrogenase nickel incorporation protein HypB [Carboxydocella thermautotrophica]GAW28077.1 hydrogenase accessory protein HypB [Carboxydocella sp. ULO1]GAW32546.1 hydrogenase accessory protein HypB [Carboxydocella sp. JDF658]SKA18506.1 hydrogenase nickel incorporation protein HypB [Carboxydocella sporoproducens DSM 16521]
MMKIEIKTDILISNDQQAELNRQNFRAAGVKVFNFMGSPGAGKTTLLERTIAELKNKLRLAVIEGDIYTSKDAERIEAHGIPVVQINTEGACHLDARMVARVLPRFDLNNLDLLIIENVGNLVCPVEFQLGEDAKVAVLSVIEGDDKPLKYPLIFRESEAVVVNKIDLLPFCNCNMESLTRDILSINPDIKIFPVSCRTGEGLQEWIDWLFRRTGA